MGTILLKITLPCQSPSAGLPPSGGMARTDFDTYAGEARYFMVRDEGICAAGSYRNGGTAIACFWAANSEMTVRKDLTSASDTNIINAYARSLIGVE